MRRATIGWLGAGLAVSTALGAQACGSGGTGGGTTTTTNSHGGSTSSASGSTSSSGGGGATSSSSGSASTSSSGTASSSSGTASSSSGSTSSGGPDSVLMHHKNPSRDGVYIQPTFTKAAIGTLHKDTTFAPTAIQGH